MAESISVRGAIDLHIHSYPCLFPRIADDRQMVESAAAAGMRAIMLKCHHESTVSRAYHLNLACGQSVQVFGGIVLNNYVGGINPAAAEAALRMGAKEVWMPTVDAAYHAEKHGGRTGSYDVQTPGERRAESKAISVLRDGKLTDEACQVLDLIAQHNAILGTAHLSPTEIVALVREAGKRGVNKILITHPFFKVPALNLDTLKILVKLGAVAEFGYCTVSPQWAYATIDQVKETIETLGPNNCVLISDGGQRHNPMPVEGLRIFAQCLHEKGLSERAVEQLIVSNPAALLGLA